MTFKANWEKTITQHQLPSGIIEKMVQLAFPDKKLLSFDLIAGGCANINIKILLSGEKYPLNLRIYLRDKDAAYREQKLGDLLRNTIPAPMTYYIGEIDGYSFAMTEFMPGISLRDLLLGDLPHDVGGIMHEVGILLSKINAHEFSKAGFFDKDLHVISHITSEIYLNFARECLKDKIVLSFLTPMVISKIDRYFVKYAHLFPNDNVKHLVHVDFDPANILVDEVNGTWKISGVLDWEFAFSGSILCDVANMLRYAHQMPPEYQHSFLQGLEISGISLPENWEIVIHLLNILSLLDCLKRSDPQLRPNQCNDIRELINHILQELDRAETKTNVYESYEKIATWYDKTRSRDLIEKPYLDMAISYLKPSSKILDLGCGMGEPIAKYFIDKGFELTGVDGSQKLIEIAKIHFPRSRFIIKDMREINLNDKFECVIAWNSLFHLTQEDQRLMFNTFENILNPGGILIFTSGPEAGELWSDNGGESLYHASLSPDEYKQLLQMHRFELISCQIEDKTCGGATVWLAQFKDERNNLNTTS